MPDYVRNTYVEKHPHTTPYVLRRTPDPIAVIAQAEAEGRELTPAQKELAWKLITAAWDQSTEE